MNLDLKNKMLTLSTSPELETRLEAEAKRFGLTPEEHALQILSHTVAPLQIELSEEEFEAGLDEMCDLFADIPFGTKELRALKEEEMALEDAKQERLFGRRIDK